MLSEEQMILLHDAISAYGQAIHDEMPGPVGEARLSILDLVSSFLDPLRPRDPKVELPEEGQDAVVKMTAGYLRPIAVESYQSANRDWWEARVAAWWPAPELGKEGG